MVQSRRRASPPAGRPTAIPASGLLTTTETAALLRVHPKQVYRLFARGLPHRRVGDEWRYDREEVLAWAGGASPSAAPAGSAPPIVASNGDVVVGVLLALASADPGPTFGGATMDRAAALGALRRRAVLAAGFHGATFPAETPEGRLARLHLVRREVGLVAAPGREPRLADLPRARIASRPRTAGVRSVLDRALDRAGVDSASVAKRSAEHASHLEVVSAVARGEADLGIATGAWAHALGLSFLALDREDYGLLFLAEDLGAPAAVRLCEVAQGRTFQERLAATTGYDARECWRIHLDPRPAATAAPSTTAKKARS